MAQERGTTDGPERAGGFWRAERGGIAILTALLLPVLVGGLALGAETGYWYMLQRQAQHAADMAAYSGAVRLARKDTQERARTGAIAMAMGSGLPQGSGTVDVRFPAVDTVEVIVTDTRARLFTRIFLDDQVEVRARAVARITRDDRGVPVCMLSLAATADKAVWLDGSADIDLGPCAVEARSTSPEAFFSGGASDLIAGCVNVAGGAQGNPVTTTICDQVNTGAVVRPVPVQLLGLEPVTGIASVPLHNSNISNTTVTPTYIHPSGVPMARFDNGMAMQGNVTLRRGLYIVNGGRVRTSGWTVVDASEGIAFFLMNGAYLDFGNNTVATLTAMQDGPWKDVLVFDTQDTASARTHVLVSTRVTGAVFTPRATIEFRGGTGVDDGCFMMVMNRLYFTGSARITADCAASTFDLDTFGLGGTAEGTGVVELVE